MIEMNCQNPFRSMLFLVVAPFSMKGFVVPQRMPEMISPAQMDIDSIFVIWVIDLPMVAWVLVRYNPMIAWSDSSVDIVLKTKTIRK